MYKMIAIDIDDTLLNDDLIVTEGTKAALAEAIENGVFVTLERSHVPIGQENRYANRAERTDYYVSGLPSKNTAG